MLTCSSAAVLTTVLTNKATEGTEQIVAPALLKAGLPPTSLKPFIEDLVGGDTAAAIKLPGVTPTVLAVAEQTFTITYEKAFEVVFLVTLSWGILSCIAAWFTPSIEDLYTDEVMRQLRDGFGEEREIHHVVPDAYPITTFGEQKTPSVYERGSHA